MGSTTKSTEGQKRDSETPGKKTRGEKMQVGCTHAEAMPMQHRQLPLPVNSAEGRRGSDIKTAEVVSTEVWLPAAAGRSLRNFTDYAEAFTKHHPCCCCYFCINLDL